MLVSFLLLSIFFSVKNIAIGTRIAADEHENNITKTIKTVTEKILGKNGYLFGFRGNIIDWIGTSIYNHYTKHNLRETGWYHGKFYIYGGGKIKITKNLYLDVYYSFLKLIPFFIIDIFIYKFILAVTLFAFITISINIRIYKNFYLAIAPMSWIGYKILDFLIYLSHQERTRSRNRRREKAY